MFLFQPYITSYSEYFWSYVTKWLIFQNPLTYITVYLKKSDNWLLCITICVYGSVDLCCNREHQHKSQFKPASIFSFFWALRVEAVQGVTRKLTRLKGAWASAQFGHTYNGIFKGCVAFWSKGKIFMRSLPFILKGRFYEKSLLYVLDGKILRDMYGIKPNASNLNSVIHNGVYAKPYK